MENTNELQSRKLLEFGFPSDSADLHLEFNEGTREYETKNQPYRDLDKSKGDTTLPSWSWWKIFKILPGEIGIGYKLRLGKDFIYYGDRENYLCYYPVDRDDYLTPILFIVEYLVTNEFHRFS